MKAIEEKGKRNEERLNRIRSSTSEARQIELENEAMKSCGNSILVDGVNRGRREGIFGLSHRTLWDQNIIPRHFPHEVEGTGTGSDESS